VIAPTIPPTWNSLALYAAGVFQFIGKSSLARSDVGYMFRNLHITLNRHNEKASSTPFQKSMEAIDEGRSVAFPEEPYPAAQPGMIEFKDGAFR